MKVRYIASTAVLGVLLTGCAIAPVRDDSSVQNTVSMAAAGMPKLPASGEAYLSDTWFAEPLTSTRAVQAALLNNPQVRAELSRLDFAHAELIQAGLLSNPMLELMLLRPNDGGRFELQYALMQSLYDLFTRTDRIVLANAARQRVQAEVMMRLVSVAQDAETAYYDAISASELVHLQKELLALEQSVLTLQTRQARQGIVTSSMVLAQQATTSQRSHELRTAEIEHTKALSALAQQLGLSSAKPLVLQDRLPALALSVLNEPELQAIAQKHRPELAASTANIEQANAERKLQTGFLRNTDASLGIAGVRESSGLSLNGLAAQISLPIFDTGHAQSSMSNARISQAKYQAETVQRLIPLEVELSLATFVTSSKALQHADYHLQQQQQLEQLATRNFQQGVSDYLDMTSAKRLRLLSQMERLQTQQILLTAYVDLERATGVAMHNHP